MNCLKEERTPHFKRSIHIVNNTECVMTAEFYRLMKLMSDMFGTQNVQWSTNLDKVEISVDTSVATVDPRTLVC